MKIHILFEFQEGPWGGGNQFLKALKNQFIIKGVYESDINKSDSILFNSYPFRHLEYFEIISDIKKRNRKTLVFHRLDGPISIVRGQDFEIDKIIFKFNNIIADGTIFQSKWIRNESEKLGLKINQNHEIIINAPESSIFYKRKNDYNKKNETKIKLIATSWSGNIRKGFDVYQWLDENLDFSRYEMTFVGNSPVQFRNIIYKKPMNSIDLANELRKHHIYVTASKHEPCSNALIEAMHCGLPAIAYDNGGNPDIIGKGGELFKNNNEIIERLNLIVDNYEIYQKNILLPPINEVADKYYNFMFNIFLRLQRNDYKSKKVTKHKIKDFNKYLSFNKY